MKNRLFTRVLLDTLRQSLRLIVLFAVLALCNLGVFFMYSLSPEPFIYSILICIFFYVVWFACSVRNQYLRAKNRVLSLEANDMSAIFEANTLAEKDYQSAIKALIEQNERLISEYETERRNMTDYYVTWVHQIKTPIAVMKMRLGAEDTEEYRALSSELFRIEQYVDMVLQYVRLDSKTTDLRLEEYSLDELVREAIRKYASQFIIKGLRVSFEESGYRIVTDKKLFLNILEQLLSNAIKYTPKGVITISFEDGRLKISDTGIGIAREDLKRIFEKGYTGINGRMGEKSSGIGLYLCKRSADMLRIPIYAESEQGRGSTFVLRLSEE